MKNNLIAILFCATAFTLLFNSACAQTEGTRERVFEDINSLKAYETDRGKKRREGLKTKNIENRFSCLETSPVSCEQQEINYKKSTASYSKRKSESFSEGGSYIVSIGFNNTGEYPIMYQGKGRFESKSQEESDQLIDAAFSQYLGSEFIELRPQFFASDQEGVYLKIEIDDPDYLDRFLDDESVKYILHVNNSQIEEHAGRWDLSTKWFSHMNSSIIDALQNFKPAFLCGVLS